MSAGLTCDMGTPLRLIFLKMLYRLFTRPCGM